MTAIIPRHHYCSLHSADEEHFMYDQYGYPVFTTEMDRTQLNNATGIFVENSTPAATNFDGAHRFSIQQASDWYYKLRGWRFNGTIHYFDYRSFDTRLANLQSGMWVYNGLEDYSNDRATITNATPSSGMGFWGKHLGFFHQKYQSNGVYDYCPYFLSYGAYDGNGNLLYGKQMNHPVYYYDAGDQIIAQAFLNISSGTAVTVAKEWETFSDGGGQVVTTITTKDFQSLRPDLMYQFKKDNRYDQYEYVVAYGSVQDLRTNNNVTNKDLATQSFVTDETVLQQQIDAAIAGNSYSVPVEFFDDPDLYPSAETPEAKQSAIDQTKQDFLAAGDGNGNGPQLGIVSITAESVQGFSSQETHQGVPVWKHWVAGANPNSLSPVFG